MICTKDNAGLLVHHVIVVGRSATTTCFKLKFFLFVTSCHIIELKRHIFLAAYGKSNFGYTFNVYVSSMQCHHVLFY